MKTILSIILVSVLIYSALFAFGTIIFGGYADFPCDYYLPIDDTNKCITPEAGTHYPYPEIETFLTTRKAAFMGGGCDHREIHGNTFNLEGALVPIQIVLQNGDLLVDQQSLSIGNEIHFTQIFNPNPWVINRFTIKNLGYLPECGKGTDSMRLVISGEYGTEKSTLKGWLITLPAIAGTIALLYKRAHNLG